MWRQTPRRRRRCRRGLGLETLLLFCFFISFKCICLLLSLVVILVQSIATEFGRLFYIYTSGRWRTDGLGYAMIVERLR